MTTPKVLLVGIDGVRYDALGRLPTPALDRVSGRGFLVSVPVDPVAPTISGPSWASILTGTLASAHKIRNNDLRGHALGEHPDVLTLVTRAQPEVVTFAAAAWAPLLTDDSGGPLLAGRGYRPDHGTAQTGEELGLVDERVIEKTLGVIAELDGRPSLLFCYLGAVDEVGHAVGTGPDYDAAVERADAGLGRLIDAVEGPDGDWTVIVATDHGHRDGGGHGGDDPHERTARVAACGPDVPADPGRVAQVDVAAHVLSRFGVAVDDPALVGRPFGVRG